MPAQGVPEEIFFCGLVERGFVRRFPCPETEQLAAGVGGLRQS